MKIVIIEDSTLVMEKMIKSMLDIKKIEDELIVLSCPGHPFSKEEYMKLLHEIKNVTWSHVKTEEDLKQELIKIIEKDKDCKIALDLTIFYNSGLKYENFVTVRIVNNLLAKHNLINANQITIYSQYVDLKLLRSVLPLEVKTYVRATDINFNDVKILFEIITNKSSTEV